MAINWNDVVFTIENTVIDVTPSDVMLLVSGVPGESATIDGVSAETLPAGSEATVENLGTNRNAVFKFGIPKGDKGEKGDKGDKGDPGETDLTGSASGSLVTLTDAADAPVADLTVAIEPVQEGTGDPSPENVRPITGWDACNVTRTGKNLLPNDRSYPFTNKGVTVSKNADGSITLSGAKNESRGILANVHVFEKNIQIFHGKYLKEQINGTVGIVVTYYDSNGQWVNAQTGTNIQLNVPSRATKMNIQLRIDTNDDVTGTILHPMICENRNDTYEPYQGTTYSVSFGDAGTVYGGMLDVPTGVLTVDRIAKKISDFTWDYDSNRTRFVSTNTSSEAFGKAKPTQYTSDLLISSVLSANYSPIGDRSIDNTVAIFDSSNMYLVCKTYTSVTDFVTALGNEVICYTLDTPITVQLTPAEVKTILGLCNVWADTGDITSLTYWKVAGEGIAEAISNASANAKYDDTQTRAMITNSIETTNTASKSYSAGNLIILNGQLLRATTGIGIGGTITIGSNAEVITLETLLSELSA